MNILDQLWVMGMPSWTVADKGTFLRYIVAATCVLDNFEALSYVKLQPFRGLSSQKPAGSSFAYQCYRTWYGTTMASSVGAKNRHGLLSPYIQYRRCQILLRSSSLFVSTRSGSNLMVFCFSCVLGVSFRTQGDYPTLTSCCWSKQIIESRDTKTHLKRR